MKQLVVYLLFTLLLVPGAPRALELSGLAAIQDGDTIEIDGQRIRLLDMDAFETAQRCEDAAGRVQACGKFATIQLATLIGQSIVHCVGHEHDRYDRLLAYCHAAGRDLGAEMVRAGFALTYPGAGTYDAEQAAARRDRAGFWAGTFEHPMAFRKARWEVARQKSPAGCPIKGNISRNGRIYHVPYSQFYDRTRINPARGERWFCSEREAIDAGWRAPLN